MLHHIKETPVEGCGCIDCIMSPEWLSAATPTQVQDNNGNLDLTPWTWFPDHHASTEQVHLLQSTGEAGDDCKSSLSEINF